MFKGQTFLIVRSCEDSEDSAELSQAKTLLQENGATIIEKEEHDNDKNYLEEEEEQQQEHDIVVNHIITKSIQFIEYGLAIKSMIPITLPNWVRDSISSGKPVNYKNYNPDPKFFFKDVFICVADNLPIGDKEAIYGGVKAFGGNYLDVLTKYTTHLIAVDITNEKSIIASSAIHTNDNDSHSHSQNNGIDIKIVLPHWIDHCITLGRKIDESAYLLPNPSILKQDKQLFLNKYSSIPEEELAHSQNYITDFFKGKSFYICQDYNVSERLINSVESLIDTHGGKVNLKFNEDLIDVYIGKFRSGDSYSKSCKSNRIVVGNLPWLYHVIVTNKWILPINSNLLHYPIPNESLLEFKNLKISITNYSGDSRAYLVKLITYLGGTFTKTLSKDNDYLISAKDEGKKHLTAKEKWLNNEGNPKIKIVNHLWLEDCFAQWKLIEFNQSKYQFFGNGQNSMESLIGRTKLDEIVLKQWNGLDNLDIDHEKDSQNVDDSMSEDEATQIEAATTKTTTTTDPEPRHRGRAAAVKAALKLHDNISDLNNFEKVKKSTKKLNAFADNWDGTPVKRSNPDADDNSDSQPSPLVKKLKTDTGSESQSEPEESSVENEEQLINHVVAIMTGCEKEISLSRSDIAKLTEAGIQVLSDFPISHTISINTLIAPKILRTEKFLRSLSMVDNVVHPQYLMDVLERLNDNEKEKDNSESINYSVLAKQVDLHQYSLAKYIPVKELNIELGYPIKHKGNGLETLLNSPNRGQVFNELNLNISANLNGGAEVISGILEDHGMTKCSIIKSSITMIQLKKCIIESTIKNDSICILIAHKSKDTKLINNFKKLNVNANANAIVVEWDWCVKSIFKGQLEPFQSYQL
ncbi:regulator of Ty1 transposition [Scheffersomyces amazonensis]|uniref:regulator of Ty1 transposition n=1 Tax=Scheffersomyces amazonensis TaxID=1078765 RepID=UPI00315D8843